MGNIDAGAVCQRKKAGETVPEELESLCWGMLESLSARDLNEEVAPMESSRTRGPGIAQR